MVSIAGLLHRLTAGRPVRLISRNGRPYLERYYLGRTGPLTWNLHRFVSGDGDPEPHDHPWRAWSLVLTGWYVEVRHVLSGRHGLPGRARAVRWFNVLSPRHIHRVARTRPDTWTLFVHTPSRKGWGFFRRVHGDGTSGVLYYQPHDPVETGWHITAPRGRESGREPGVGA